METLQKTCLECGRSLKGRADKRFCDDYCRNAYNNKQNSDQNNFVRKVNYILRKNRRILQELIPEGEGMSKMPKQKLLSAGFDPNYHTHQIANRKGDVYRFCYEYGWLPIEGDWVLLVKRKEENN